MQHVVIFLMKKIIKQSPLVCTRPGQSLSPSQNPARATQDGFSCLLAQTHTNNTRKLVFVGK